MTDEKTLASHIQTNPHDAAAWYDLGTLIDQTGKNRRDAGSCYLKAISLEPFTAHFHSALITMLIDAGREEEALKAIDAAVELLRDPEARSEETLASVLAEAGKHACLRADRDLVRVIVCKLEPNHVSGNADLALVAVAYSELDLNAKMLDKGFKLALPFEALLKLPATRLDVCRYNA